MLLFGISISTKNCNLGKNVGHFTSVDFENTKEPHWEAKELKWLEGRHFSLFLSQQQFFWRSIAKNSQKEKSGIGKRDLDGTIKMSFWGKTLEGYNLSKLELKTRQTPSRFHLCTQRHFLMTAQYCTSLENRLNEVIATGNTIIRVHNQGLHSLSQGFSYMVQPGWNTEYDNKITQTQWLISMKLIGICHSIHDWVLNQGWANREATIH